MHIALGRKDGIMCTAVIGLKIYYSHVNVSVTFLSWLNLGLNQIWKEVKLE